MEGKSIQAIERNSSGGLIRMTPLQRKRANALIHNLCYNYYDRMCIVLDCECVQSNSYSVMCKRFRAAVLPQDKALFAEVIKSRESKRCVR
ncbi:MAG: cysteine-rich VLP protein [Oscillospiraceae bacterium]|nr:cysteine-rich VLP protein [Oscillospiraceae bacterium]